MAEKRRMEWQWLTGYGRRALAEAATGRWEHLTSPKLRVRTLLWPAGRERVGCLIAEPNDPHSQARLGLRRMNTARAWCMDQGCRRIDPNPVWG